MSTKTLTRPEAATKEAKPAARVFEIEMGFPKSETPPVYEVEAASEDEAREILCKWFRARLRTVGDRPVTRKGV